MVLLLLTAFVLLFLCFLEGYGKYLEAWLKSTAVWCGLLFFATEALSLFGCLNQAAAALFWTLVCAAALLAAIKTGGYKAAGRLVRDGLKAVNQNRFFTLILFALGILAVVTVPYNWDSMTYHLARIAHWVQNGSVAHYATAIHRQVSTPPLHEFVGLHVYLLSGERDLFLNFIQYGALLTNAWLVYGIADKLGCKGKYCKAGVLMLLSMPVAFGEALTTQNDHFSGMWLLIFAWYLLDFLHREKRIEYGRSTIIKCGMMAACVGFGYTTKPSVCIGMLLMAAVLLVCCIIRRDSPMTLGRLICIALPVMLLLIVPEALRNIATFGSVFPDGTGARQLVGTWKPNYLLVNGLKNLAFNLPFIFVTRSGRWIETAVRRSAGLLGVDINDPSISEDGREFFLGAPDNYGHDTAVSSIIMITAILCFLWCLYRWKKQGSYQRLYSCLSVSLFMVFCMTVRWEPFVSRYMLPYLMLLCPMISVQLQDISEHAKREMWRISCVPAVGCLCIAQLCGLFAYHVQIARTQGTERPEGYFYSRSNITEEYRQACEYILQEGYEEVGMVLGPDSYEYPVWRMLQGQVRRIDSVLTENETGKYEDLSYVPECLFAAGAREDRLKVHGREYTKVLGGQEAGVYVLTENLQANCL